MRAAITFLTPGRPTRLAASVHYAEGRGVPQAEAVHRLGAERPFEGDLGYVLPRSRRIAGVTRVATASSARMRSCFSRADEQDDLEALRWFHAAAEQGNARAQYNLGALYAEGRGVTQDDVSAHKWFDLAASGTGDIQADAVAARDVVSIRLTDDERADSGRLVEEWRAEHPPSP